MLRRWGVKAVQQKATRHPAGANKRQTGGGRWRLHVKRQGQAKRMSGRVGARRSNATISWLIERQWPDGLTVLALRIIPYPKAGGASCVELLKYAFHSVWQKMCKEMMLAEVICCPPPPPAASPCHVCSNCITINGALPIFKGSIKI